MFIIYIPYPSTSTSLGLVTIYLKIKLYTYSRARVPITNLRVFKGHYCTEFHNFILIVAGVTSTSVL